jgi:cytoskeletal protein CcmA (bactofilin family)
MNESLQAFLDQGTFFEGKLSFQTAIRVDGHFRGEAKADGTLVVGEGGLVEADVTVSVLVVHGTVIGDAIAKERIHVGPTGRVAGSMSSPRLRIDEGAQIEARVQMGEIALPCPEAPAEDPEPASD